MKKVKNIIFCLYMFCGLCSYAIELNGIYPDATVVYSPDYVLWSQASNDKDDIVFTKHIVDYNSQYVSDCSFINLHSDFEFLISGRLIGIDNTNLKYYEILYIDNSFVEKMLSVEDVEKIFSDIDVLKISDFKKGTYSIINDSDDKYILLFNDTDEKFENYSFIPENIANNPDIMGLVKLPKRGKILFLDKSNEKSKVYTIRVR